MGTLHQREHSYQDIEHQINIKKIITLSLVAALGVAAAPETETETETEE